MPLRDANVGVIIAAHDAQATIGRAVASALGEPEAGEVIVVVDGATDATAEAAEAADDGSGRLQVIVRASSGGPAAARNQGLAASRAPWVCPLDSDDYFLPGRLARLSAWAGGCDFVADDLLQVVEGASDARTRPMIGDRIPLPLRLDFTTFVRANISRPNLPRAELGFLKPLMRRAFLDAHDLAYDERLRLGEDFIFYARALALGARFRVTDACGYVAVERAGSISAAHRAVDLRNLVQASRELEPLALAAQELAALRAHRSHVAGKLALREFLDAKRARGLLGAAAVLLRAPQTAPYVITSVATDVLRRRSQTSAPVMRTA